jgi:hypothetical protein
MIKMGKKPKSDEKTIYEGDRKVHELGNSKSVTLPRYDQLVTQVEALLGPLKKFVKAKVYIDTKGLPVWEYRLVLAENEKEEKEHEEG